MNKLTVKEVDCAGKKVIVRADFNVPLDDQQNITDNRRIQASLPIPKYILTQVKHPLKTILTDFPALGQMRFDFSRKGIGGG